VIGLTAAERNMIGSKQTMKYLENLLDHIPPLIVTANALKNHPDCKVEDIPKFKRLITNLEVFKRTLEYSMCDSMFNYTIPGAINGVASSFVLLSGIWHQPFALPFIALYSFAQSVRNGMDLIRVLHHKIDKKDQFNISSNPMSRKMEERVPLIQREEYSIKIAGQNKVNQIAISKRRFFSSNTFNFTVFTAGAIVTFISIPALAVGVGAATLPIGLGMLGYGAASTGIANNIWPNKFKPRNGDCGVDRFSLTEGSCLDEIGERRLLKKILKDNLYAQTKSKKMSYLWHHCKYFYSKCITALPDLPNRLSSYSRYYPFGQRKGRKLLHKINKESFKTFQSQLGLTRTDLLNQLLKVKGIGFKKLKAGASFEQQWMACESLGIADDILNLYLQDELDLLSPSSRCGHEDENSYLSKLKSSGLFSEDNGQLKLILNQRIQHEKIVSLFEKIDYYLHFDFIEKLRYEQYALNDFFWELKSPPSKIVTKIAKKYKPIKSSLKQMKDIVLAPYSLFKKNNQIPL
jgi:hypothetical protein